MAGERTSGGLGGYSRGRMRTVGVPALLLAFCAEALAAGEPASAEAVAGKPVSEQAPAVAQKQPAANCLITVRTTRKSGEKSAKTYRLRKETKAACEKSAALFRSNFSPQATLEKKVSAQWMGKAGAPAGGKP